MLSERTDDSMSYYYYHHHEWYQKHRTQYRFHQSSTIFKLLHDFYHIGTT